MGSGANGRSVYVAAALRGEVGTPDQRVAGPFNTSPELTTSLGVGVSAAVEVKTAYPSCPPAPGRELAERTRARPMSCLELGMPTER